MLTTHELQAKFAEEVDAKARLIDPNDEADWHSLTVGYALGNGYSPDDANRFATYIRYHTELG